MTARPTARPEPPPAITSAASSSTAFGVLADRPPQEQHGTADAGHHPGHGIGPRRPGCLVGDGDLEQGGPEVVTDDGGVHDGVGVPGHVPVLPPDALDQGLEPGRTASSSTRPSSSRAGAVRGSSRSMRVMCLMPVHPSARGPLDRGHQPVVELEGRTGQAGPVEREIRMVPAAQRSRRTQIRQRLGRGQDAVDVGQGGGDGRRVGAVVLHRGHAPGPVVGGQDQRREPQRVADLSHPAPRARMTLARDEKSSRP